MPRIIHENFIHEEMVTLDMKSVGEMIAAKRKLLGMSQAELAHYAKTSQSRICQIENGIHPIKDVKVMARLCRAVCDDGSIFSGWILAYLKLPFFGELSLRNTIEEMKGHMASGPLRMGE